MNSRQKKKKSHLKWEIFQWDRIHFLKEPSRNSRAESINDIKNATETICSRGEQMEHKISELEDRNFEITQWKAKRKKKGKRKKAKWFMGSHQTNRIFGTEKAKGTEALRSNNWECPVLSPD